MWKKNIKDICVVYKELFMAINSPPLLTAIGRAQSPLKNSMRGKSNNKYNKFAEKFMPDIEERVFNVHEKHDIIEAMAK